MKLYLDAITLILCFLPADGQMVEQSFSKLIWSRVLITGSDLSHQGTDDTNRAIYTAYNHVC